MSYGTRSKRGQRFVERITTVAQAVRKQGKAILSVVQEAVQSFYANTDPLNVFEALKV